MKKTQLCFSPIFFLLFVLILPYLAYAQEQGAKEIEEVEEAKESEHGSSLAARVSPLVGIFALLGLSLQMAVQVADSSAIISISTLRKMIPTLSIAAGTIHMLLVQDHMAEAFEWGVFFAVTGAAQVIYGFVFVKVQNSFMHYLGVVGNAAIVTLYVYARLFTPPFSPELGPVSEIDAPGIIANIIEVILVILLLYSVRVRKLKVKRTT